MTVTSLDEIEINEKKYRIKGAITGGWLDPFPEQQAFGDPSYSNRRDLSSWIITGPLYIGAEEIDEKVDFNMVYWTNCITKYRNHILPPRLAASLTLPNPLSVVNADMEDTTGWTGGSRSSVRSKTGTYSWAVGNGGVTAYQDLTWTNDYRGKTFTFKCWVYDVDATPTADISINDGVGTSTSVKASTGVWTQLSVTRTLDASATRLRIQLFGWDDAECFFDDITLPAFTVDTSASLMANFNGELYVTLGTVLAKLNAGRTAFTFVHDLEATITALVPSLNSRLYFLLGDSVNYYWMDTNEAFTQSDSANAYWGFQHDAKLFKVKSDGTVEYSTDPDGGSPTWISGGAINDIADQIEGFVVGRDANGNIVPYAATNSIIKAYDASTPQWVDTEAKLPNHPIGGKGHTYWNGKTYFSYGLAVKEYYPETGAFLDIGLTERDGLPVEYNGEIVKLLGDTGIKGMFAAIDASVTSGNSKSGLYLYDGIGWQCWWIDTSNNGVMNDIIVSSASSGYAVYWNCGGTLYYIDIPRGIENPDKISQNYATAGILLTPWFDAGNPVAAKLAKLLTDFAKGITATETVALKYRLDHAQTDLDTGWTLMDTLNTAGEDGYNEELIATRAGASYKAIQFRLDFVTTGSTAKPDIQSLVFYYKKRTGSEKIRTWAVTVIHDAKYGTAKDMAANLKAAITSEVDVPFSYHPNDDSTESFFVNVDCPNFSEQTGRDYEANYALRLTEV